VWGTQELQIKTFFPFLMVFSRAGGEKKRQTTAFQSTLLWVDIYRIVDAGQAFSEHPKKGTMSMEKLLGRN
jgi:hypothetical protein